MLDTSLFFVHWYLWLHFPTWWNLLINLFDSLTKYATILSFCYILIFANLNCHIFFSVYFASIKYLQDIAFLSFVDNLYSQYTLYNMRLSYKSTFHHRNPQYNKIDFLHLSKTRQWALLLILKSIKPSFIIYHILKWFFFDVFIFKLSSE